MKPNCVDVATYAHPFLNEGAAFKQMHEGVSVADIIKQANIEPKYLADVQVTISKGRNISVVPMSEWAHVRPKSGAHVLVTPRVAAAAIPVILGALLPTAATYVAGALFGAAGILGASAVGYALTYAAVTIVGSLLINALIPPPSRPEAATQDHPNYAITGSSNAENRYGVFPTVLGRHLMYPPKTARGYTEGEGDNIYFRGRYTFGYGPVALESLKIGTTPITDFDGVELEFLNVDKAATLAKLPDLAPLVKNWRSGDTRMSLYPDDIAEDSYSVKLAQNVAVVRSTRDRAISASVDVTYQGLVHYDSNNSKQTQSVEVQYRFRAVGSSQWVDVGVETHSAKSTAQMRFTKTITFPSAGVYDVEVKRLSIDSQSSTVRDDGYLSAVRSVQAGSLPSHPQIAEVALRIKASEQLNGQIATLNAIVLQMAPIWDGQSWSNPQPVRHPAWIYARALMGPMLSNPVASSRIQLEDLLAWATQEPHWTCDAVIDQPTPLAEVLDLICATGRARRALRDLKYSIIRDGGAGPIVQQFSPRNSWGFSGSIKFPKDIHGFRVRCLSERQEWQQDEITVYADGYDETNATEFETLDLQGVVLAQEDATGGNAWRLGRYHLAQAILRPEQFTWQCDLEHLRVNMGDKVRLVHDVPLIGVGAGRIRQYESNKDGTLAAFVLDEFMSLAGNNYRICLRHQNGSELIFRATPPSTYDGRWSVTEAVSAKHIRVGDLLSVEEMGVESMEVLISAITHQGDLKATLTGVPAAPAVLDADQGDIPPYVPIVTKVKPRDDLRPIEPKVRGVNIEIRSNPSVVAVIEMGAEDRFFVSSHLGVLYNANGVEIARGEFTGKELEFILPEVGSYALKIYAKDSAGRLSEPAIETLYRDASLTIPRPVEDFAINVVEQQAHLTWKAAIDPLIDHYHVRFLSSGLVGGWERAVDVETQARSGSLTAPALKGQYLIKAVSIFGQSSPEARMVMSDVDPLASYNAVLKVSEAPKFSGSRTAGLVANGSHLELPASGATGGRSGTYSFAQKVDLSEVYTSRVTVNLQAYGYRTDNKIERWSKLANVTSLGGVTASSETVQVVLMVRTTSGDPASSSAVWSSWQPIRIGEYVARGYEFKLELATTDSDVSVRVDLADVHIDMPDRVLSGKNVPCPAGGVRIKFSPAFKAEPSIIINGQGLPPGAVSKTTAKDRHGFHQEFLDQNGAAITASFDWHAAGYGRES